MQEKADSPFKKTKVLFLSYYIYDPSVPGFKPKYELLSSEWKGDIFHLTTSTKDLKAGSFTFRGCKSLQTNVIFKQMYYLWFCIRSAMRHGPYDVIISYDPMICGIISILLKFFMRSKLLIEVNTDHFYRVPGEGTGIKSKMIRRIKEFMMRISFSRADAVKFINSKLATEYRARFDLPEDKIHQDVFFSYIGTQAFYPSEKPEENTILMVGHPFRIKGVDILIKAFNRISTDYPDVKLRIIGMCRNLDHYKSMVADNSKVEFLPGIPHDEIVRYFQNCMFYVLASRTEAMGRVMIEAMACAKPVIGSRVSGVLDVVDDGKTGLIFESENDEDLSEKMRILLDNPETRMSMGRAGLKRVTEYFSPEIYARRYFDFMSKVISEPENNKGDKQDATDIHGKTEKQDLSKQAL